jgi:hypothetical protein
VTTATRATAPSGVLTRSAAGCAAVIATVVVLAGVVAGRPGALGALCGGLLVLVVFWAGTASLELMTRKSAEIALLVAMITYSAQIMVVLGVLIGLTASGLVDEVSRGWLAVAVIAGSLVWSAAQIAVAGRARIPTYASAADADCYVPARQALSADAPSNTSERSEWV